MKSSDRLPASVCLRAMAGQKICRLSPERITTTLNPSRRIGGKKYFRFGIKSMENDAPADKWIKKILAHLAVDRGASVYTQRNYKQALTEFSRWHLGERKSSPVWEKLQRDDFRSFVRFLGRNNLSRAATQLRFSALRTFYKFLIRHGGATQSPIKNLSLPKPVKRLPKFLTREQMEALLLAPLHPLTRPKSKSAGRPVSASLCYRDVAVLETIYSCGLRVSELCGLRADDIDWSERVVRVR